MNFKEYRKEIQKVEKTYDQLQKREKIVSIVANTLFFVVGLSVMLIMLGIVSSI
jgi:hypothetical protein